MLKSKQKELHYYIYLDKVSNRELPVELLSNQEQEKIKKAVTTLPYPINTIVEDYFLNEKPSREIMARLQTSQNKFYNYLHKGKFLLRQKLNSAYYDRAIKILYGTK